MRKAWHDGRIIEITEEQYIKHCTAPGSGLRQAALDQIYTEELREGLDSMYWTISLQVEMGFPRRGR